jgi:hypothetical protein
MRAAFASSTYGFQTTSGLSHRKMQLGPGPNLAMGHVWTLRIARPMPVRNELPELLRALEDAKNPDSETDSLLPLNELDLHEFGESVFLVAWHH